MRDGHDGDHGDHRDHGDPCKDVGGSSFDRVLLQTDEQNT